MKTLIVEDDFAGRYLLEAFLSRYGACQLAVDGSIAVEAFQAASLAGSPYDLVCMDIMMPVMDGKEAVQRIRSFEEASGVSSDHAAKVIMTTAVDEVRYAIESFHEHCDSYLTKPIDLRMLRNILKQLKLIVEPHSGLFADPPAGQPQN